MPEATTLECKSPTAESSDLLEGMSRQALRRNMVALVGLEILFTVGAADLNVALNPLLKHLNATNTQMGLLRSAAFLSIVGLVISPFITRRFRYKRPLVIMTHVLYVGMWGLLGAAVILARPLGIGRHLSAVVFALWFAQIFFGGFVSVPIQEYIAACIPTRYRGRFTGLAVALGGLAAIGSAAIATWMITKLPKPEAFGWCFVYCWFFAQASWLLALFAKERPAAIEEQPVPWSRRMLMAVQKDQSFRRFLGFVVLTGVLFSPVWQFLTYYGLKDLKMPDEASGKLEMVALSARLAFSVAGGVLIDKLSPRRVLPLLPVVAAAAILPVVIFAGPGALYVAKALSAIYDAVMFTGIAALVYALPKPEDRAGHYAIYFITMNLAQSAGALVVGMGADAMGYRQLFTIFLGLFVILVPVSFYLVGPRARGATF